MAVPVFTWEAGVVIAYVVVWNIGLWVFNTRNPLWRRSQANFVLITNSRSHEQQKVGRPETWFAWDKISPTHLVDGCVGVMGLTLFRAFQCCVFVFTIVYGNIRYEPAGVYFLPYFTNWTFVLFGLTGLLGVVLTVQEWARRRRPTIPCVEPSKPVSSTEGWTFALRFYQLLLTTTCSASIMLTIFYWFADYTPGSDLRFDNPVKHGASAALLLLDVALSRMPLVSFHLQMVIAYGTLYLTFLWCYYAGTGLWLYRALDWTKVMSIPYYFALPLLLMLGFIVMFAVASLREVCWRSCRSRRRSDEDLVTAQVKDGAWTTDDRSPRLAIALT